MFAAPVRSICTEFQPLASSGDPFSIIFDKCGCAEYRRSPKSAFSSLLAVVVIVIVIVAVYAKKTNTGSAGNDPIPTPPN